MLKRLMIAGAALGVALTMGVAEAQEKFKVGFVAIGPKNDGGWTQAHWTGVEALQKELGDKIEVTFLESVPEGPDAERAIEGLVQAGNKLIFTTSFGYMEPTLKVAAKYPDVMFEHATGFKTAPNVTTYNARFYEGRYIIGQIAAKMSKTGTAGYIVSFPIPEVIMGINSFMLGAQSVNPDFKLKIIWINTWMDPAKEGDAAKALFDQGVDIITQHTDSTEPLKIAQERGLLGFGQSHDMIDAAPKAQLTSIIDNWGPYYIARTKAAMDGTWKSQASWDGLAEGTVQMAPYTNMPDDVAAAAKEMEEKIRTGAFHPFTGPIYKQDGTEVVPAGQVMDDGSLLTMDYYVKGVDGTPGTN
ncbi:MAG TPA: BMP family ABC transporter substrate-binding protein [Bauldia sp.]|nr:BMP family ABC transporter substrate-binding protein [Bauldia sp.]